VVRRFLHIIILIFTGHLSLNAQQLPLFTQYKNNGFLINPAMAGYDGYTSFNLTSRKQWIGFENAPLTYSISAQTRLLRRSYHIKNRPVRNNVLKPSTKGRVGLGGFFFNDINGLVSRTGMQLTYAYHIYMHRNQLSFGLGGQMFQYKIDDSRLTYRDITDPIAQSNLNTVALIPDANFGVFFSNETYYIGFSANQLFQSVLKIGTSDLSALKMYRHYHLMGGYKFFFESGYDIEPSVLLKTSEQFLPQADITCKLNYKNDYWFGISYRTNGSLSALFGIRANQLYIGYAYDYALSSIRKYNSGSHEVFISLKIGDNARRYRWINRY